MKSLLLVLAAVCMAGNLSALTLTGKDLKKQPPKAVNFKDVNGTMELSIRNSPGISLNNFVLNEPYAAGKVVSFEYKLTCSKDPKAYLRMRFTVKGKKERTWDGFTPKAEWNKVSLPFSKLAVAREKLKDGDVLTGLEFYSGVSKKGEKGDWVLMIRNLKIEAPVKK